MHTDFENALLREPVQAILTCIMSYTTEEQRKVIYEKLGRRVVPTPASLEQEANRLYPHPQETYVSPDGVTKMYSNDNKCKAEGYITAARQYMDTIDRLRAENEKLRKALEEIAQKYADAEVIDDIGQFVFEMGEIATSALKTTTHG